MEKKHTTDFLQVVQSLYVNNHSIKRAHERAGETFISITNMSKCTHGGFTKSL